MKDKINIFRLAENGLKTASKLLTIGDLQYTSSTAFITFRSNVASSTAIQMFLSANTPDLKIYRAPAPADINTYE